MSVKVLEILPELTTGGAEKVVISYLERLQGDENITIRAVVFSKNKGRNFEKYAAENSLPVDYLNVPDGAEPGEFSALKVIAALRKYIKEYRPDVIHTHMRYVKKICAASAFLPVKIQYQTIHNDVKRIYTKKEIAEENIFKRIFKVRTVCLTEAMAKDAEKIFPGKAYVLRNGIDLASYQTGERDKYRRDFNFAADNFVIGNVGRFTTVKNQQLLIKAFDILYKQNGSYKLVFAGTGELEHEMKLLAGKLGCSDGIFFLGVRDDIPSLLQMMDMFVFPSLYEGFPVSLLEAQAAGLPCLVSDTITEEVLVRHQIQRLSPDASPEIWANAISKYKYYNYSPKYNIETYSLDIINDQVKKMYMESFEAI